MRFRLLMALIAGVMSLGIVACGGDDDDEGNGGGEAVEAPATTGEDTGTETGGGDAIEVSTDPGGALRFEQDSLRASAGSVTFDFTNSASIPHDFDIESPDGEKVADGDVVTDDEATVRANLDAGRYTFYCSVDGHRQAGMEGTLTVE